MKEFSQQTEFYFFFFYSKLQCCNSRPIPSNIYKSYACAFCTVCSYIREGTIVLEFVLHVLMTLFFLFSPLLAAICVCGSKQ